MTEDDAEPVVPHRALITVCAMLGTLMQALDSTIANVALPYMQSSLATTSDQITWVLTAYVVAAAIMTAPVGWLAARFGRKGLYITALVGFTAASMLCGIAQTMPQMVAFRLLQGIFGAALVPLSQSIMLDIYPARQRASAMAMWGMGVMLGPILGPTLGGYLTDLYDWRYVFFINLPFGIIAIIGTVLFLKDTLRNSALRFDWLGFGLLGLGIGALQLMLDRGEQLDWLSSTEIVVELVLAVLGLYLFLVHICLAEKPFISPRLFKDRNFLAGFLTMFAIGLVLLASSALLAPYLQTVGGYPIATAGLLMAPRGIGTLLAMMVSGRVLGRVDARALMLLGIAMIAVSLYEMSGWTPDVAETTLVWTTIAQGAGLGFVFTPLTVVAFATLEPALRTEGTAMFSLIRNVGSAIGVSLTETLLSQNTQIVHSAFASLITPFSRNAQTGAAFEFWNIANPASLAALNAEVTRQATIVAYSDDFLFMLYVSLPTVLFLLLMRGAKPNPAAAQETHVLE